MQATTKIRVAILTSAFIYPLSFFMHLCAITALTQSNGWDPVGLSRINSVTRLLLAIGAPFYGRYGDLYGCTTALKTSLVALVICYSLALTAYSQFMVYLSRIPLILSHSYQGSQMVITQITCRSHRASSLASLGFVFRCGLVLGPFVANQLLLMFQPRNVLLLSFLGSLLCFLIINNNVPDVVSIRDREPDPNFAATFNVARVLGVQFQCRVFLMSIIKILSAVPALILQMMAFYLWVNQFNFGQEDQQTFLTYLSVGDIVLHGLVVLLVNAVSEDIFLLIIAVVQLLMAYLVISVTTQFEVLVVTSILLASGLILLNLATRTIVTKLVDNSESGTVLGLFMMKDLLASLLSPYLQSIGVIQVKSDPQYIGWFGVVATATVTLIMMMCIKTKTAATHDFK